MHYLRRLSLETLQVTSLLILSGLPYIYWVSGQIYAAELFNRSVTISTAVPSATVTDYIKATIGSVTPIGSIELQYCTNSPIPNDTCDTPAGLSLTGAVLTDQTGNTGFTIDTTDSTSNTIILSRTASPALAIPSSYTLSNIVNPSTANQTTFIRITTYESVDGTGAYVDRGSVAFSTTPNLSVGAYVPPFLNLCVGVTVTINCSDATGTNIDMGLLGTQTTGTATSQLAASTNSVNGYSIYVLGTTMTSGNNIIPADSMPTISQKGVSQFGLNLRQNTTPSVGEDPIGIGEAIPSPGYNKPNTFSFVSGSEIASSSVSTNFNRMTVSYIANVNGSQPSGIYDTTLTYLASTQF